MRTPLLALLLLAACATASPRETAAEVEHGRLGFRYTFQRDPDSRGTNPDALVVCGVVAGGPAAAAGVRAQDVIVAINERPLASLDEQSWMRYFAALRPGDRVTLTIAARVVTVVVSSPA